jgi:hypothetical protein
VASIEKIDEHVIYENPLPQLRSACAKFPALVLNLIPAISLPRTGVLRTVFTK